MPEGDGFSVIICCYNSAGRLPDTLYHLAAQNFTGAWELIVVDNNSTDETGRTALEEWQKYHLPQVALKVVKQPKPGLNYAREKGVEHSRYGYLLFCDDDNWLADNYLSIAYDYLQENPAIGGLGGESIATSNPDYTFPPWFEHSKHNYAIGRQSDRTGDVTKRGYLWGAGFITKKSIFNRCITPEYPYLLTDRTGTLLSSGGDTELCSRIVIAGYPLHYSEKLKLKHFIAAERIDPDYYKKLIAGIDQAHAQLSKYYDLINVRTTGKQKRLLKTTKYLLKILLHPVQKKWNFEHDIRLFYFYTGINLGVDPDVIILKKFSDGFIDHSS